MSTNKIEVYTTTYCPYCIKAKQLLKAKKLDFEEINVEGDNEARMLLMQKSGGSKTIPQIFINDKHVGGCDDLYNLEDTGELNKLLNTK
jgi:glutaredoxin 3